MAEVFVKKYWDEEDVTFYIHFRDSSAYRQIEILSDKQKIRLSEDQPIVGDSMLYDQTLEDLDLTPDDFISQTEFEQVWGSPLIDLGIR